MTNFNSEQHTYLIDFFTQEAEHNRELANEYRFECEEMYLNDALQCDLAIATLKTDTSITTAKKLIRAFDTYEDLLCKIAEYDERDDIVDLLTQ
jgi:hypothetical protein